MPSWPEFLNCLWKVGTFIIWGFIHGTAQIIEKRLNKFLSKIRGRFIGDLFSCITVFAFCSIAWIFFRADSIEDAFYVIFHMFSGINQGINYFCKIQYFDSYKCSLILLLAIFDFFSLKTDVIKWIGEQATLVRWGIYATTIMLIYLFSYLGNSSFIYFQFWLRC